MNKVDFLVRFDQLSSSYLVILSLILTGLIAGLLFWIGLIPWVLRIIARSVRLSIQQGFQIWQRFFSWASWPIFFGIEVCSLLTGYVASRHLPFLTVICALIPMCMGVTACLAYMFIDLERYAVSRGHKAVHNPLKGQELAINLVRYGQAVGVPLLIAATVGMIGGFALLNMGLYLTIGREWYIVREAEPTYVDFVANALIVLLRIVDVLDFAKASKLFDLSFVRQQKWPATSLLAAFRMFFTLVLLQQISASFRKGQVLSEIITDLWNPNEPIHERAFNALPQYGPGAVDPILISLGNVASLTKEQRDRLPLILAAIGPAAIPSLVRHLHDEHEHVRSIAAASLGHLRVRGTIVLLVPLSQDPSDVVRQSLIEALGNIASPECVPTESKLAILSPSKRLWRSLTNKHEVIPVVHVEPIELAVTTLQSALSDDSLAVRAEAARALGQIGPPAAKAAPRLIMLLKDEDETVRGEAINAVGKVGGSTSEVVNALIELLEDPCPTLRASAARALGAMGEAAASACPALIPLLQDREDLVRDAAAEAIGEIGHLDGDSTEEMVEGLASPDSVIRAQTAEALGDIGETAHETAPALVEALDDQNDMVRAKAVEALGKIGEAVADLAVPGLVRALGDEDNVVSSLAAEALGEMGESAEAAIPSLILSLDHINADVRASAAESLGKLDADAIGTPDALERACQDEDADVRCQAIRALSMIDIPAASTRQSVLDGLDDTDAEVRAAAVDALCHWGDLDDNSLKVLLTLLEDPNEQVRIQVTKSLPQLVGATREVVEGLCQRLEDDTDLVQTHAAEALGQIGPAAAAAGLALLHASQNGDACVREQAIRAIILIRPSVQLDSLEESEIESEVIEALRAIEDRTMNDAVERAVEVIPIIVAPVIDPDSGQQIDLALSLGLNDSEHDERHT